MVAPRVLIVLEPRLFLAESILVSLRQRRLFVKTLAVDNLRAALKAAGAFPDALPIFLVCGVSFLKMETLIDSLRTRFSAAKIILLDERVRRGCCFIVEHVSIQGYCTLFDSQREFQKVLESVAKEKLYAAPSVEYFLSNDADRKRLRCREEFRDSFPLHSFTKKEWACFKHLIDGGDLYEFAQEHDLEERTVSNLKYRILKKLSLKRFADLFPLAHQWGFLDHAGMVE